MKVPSEDFVARNEAATARRSFGVRATKERIDGSRY
jgi:hypothetical protein